ncbi:MAG: hypothetical protein C4297_00245 [Gemmataceae bacterium]
MTRTAVLLAGMGAFLCWAGPTRGQVFQPIPPDRVEEISRLLLELSGKLPQPVKCEGDCSKATGLYIQGAGLMVIPRKDLQEGKLDGVQQPEGAPIGYLFLHRLQIVAGKEPIAEERLLKSRFTDSSGVEREVTVLYLTVHRDSDNTWKLLILSKQKQPLAAFPFRSDKRESSLPLDVSASEIQDKQTKLTVIVFGKYAADIPLKIVGD